MANRVVMITGAGKGIGRALSLAFGRAGASLALLSRSAKDLEAVQLEAGPRVNMILHNGDVGDESVVRKFVGKVIRRFSQIDVLINNAGILTPKAEIQNVETADWDETMRVNLRGPFLMMKHVIPQLVRQRSGCIINVSSGAGKREAPGWGPYAVSKFAVEGLTRIAAGELAPYGIRVNAVNPGGTRTRMRAMAYPDENPLTLPTPDDVARMFVWLASDEAASRTGQSLDYSAWASSRLDQGRTGV